MRVGSPLLRYTSTVHIFQVLPREVPSVKLLQKLRTYLAAFHCLQQGNMGIFVSNTGFGRWRVKEVKCTNVLWRARSPLSNLMRYVFKTSLSSANVLPTARLIGPFHREPLAFFPFRWFSEWVHGLTVQHSNSS